MAHPTCFVPDAASPLACDLSAQLQEPLTALLALVADFLACEPTPTTTFALEQNVAAVLQGMGQILISHAFNRAEPPAEDCPARVTFGDETYRRRRKTTNLIGTRFGLIELQRCVYECLEPGEPCRWPLEVRLGIVAGLASPALAERVGFWSAEQEQEAVRGLLRSEHGVSWSVTSLRKVTAAVGVGVAEPGATARVERVLELLTLAAQGAGKHRPTLAVGRDGVMVPMRRPHSATPVAEPPVSARAAHAKPRRSEAYKEASTGTISVSDRRGKRLGTVYFGQMPESGQGRLTKQLTLALTTILTTWHGRGGACPRLHYLSDGGPHQQTFFKQVLSRMADPWRPGQCLGWQWTLDFFHACTHLWTVAESLFGNTPTAWAWYRRTRHWLRHRTTGVANLLRSATQLRNQRKLSARRRKTFDTAYRYLRRYANWMTYADNKRLRLPIGSGVTEAACKTVFAERLKRSGMTWGVPGGQVIVDLRVLVLSGVWDRSYAAFLQNQPLPRTASYQPPVRETPRIAA